MKKYLLGLIALLCFVAPIASQAQIVIVDHHHHHHHHHHYNRLTQ